MAMKLMQAQVQTKGHLFSLILCYLDLPVATSKVNTTELICSSKGF